MNRPKSKPAARARGLLTERNLTKAGRRLGLSQPSMCRALEQPRRIFDDELIVKARAVNGLRWRLG